MGKDKIVELVVPAMAEFVASTFFVFIAAGSAMNTFNFGGYPGAVDTQIALVFGFTVCCLVVMLLMKDYCSCFYNRTHLWRSY